MEDLGNNLPFTVKLHHGVEVCVVLLGGVALHVYLDDGGCRSDADDIDTGLDVGSIAVLVDEVVQVGDGAAQEFPSHGEAVHGGILVECLLEERSVSLVAALAVVLLDDSDDLIVLRGRDGLDVLRHDDRWYGEIGGLMASM